MFTTAPFTFTTANLEIIQHLEVELFMIAGSCDIAYSTFIDNSASFGGIMLLSDTLLLVDSTSFSGNSALIDGTKCMVTTHR